MTQSKPELPYEVFTTAYHRQLGNVLIIIAWSTDAEPSGYAEYFLLFPDADCRLVSARITFPDFYLELGVLSGATRRDVAFEEAKVRLRNELMTAAKDTDPLQIMNAGVAGILGLVGRKRCLETFKKIEQSTANKMLADVIGTILRNPPMIGSVDDSST